MQAYVVGKEAKDLSRRQDIIHPSEMSHSDWCPKATYLRIKNIRDGGQHVKESFAFQSLSIFQHGHEVHHKWQTWLAEMGLLWGDWKCRECGAYWTGTAGHRCPHCRSWNVVYQEIPLDAEEEWLISGSADGGVPEHKALMEFKTVGSGTVRVEAPEILKAHTHKTIDGKNLIDYEGLWRGITRPFPSHQRQGQTYLFLCKLMGLDFDKVIYVYESKFNQGVKEFVVKRRESIIEPLLDQAREILDALDNGAPPPRCPYGGCKHCEPKETDGQEESGAGAPEDKSEDRPARRRARPDNSRPAVRRRASRAT